ncbi:nucleoside-diphosphate sugar epimerase [Pseudovibrio japonicus]|uniref:Nucleoside-diphosphate sugar epimerase n=1 Tax=Pseudovibrio japonicus TaxID=366534 RepID=A0ABQ3E271_9HYPH|nr:NAD-dependent epimerase/dehydratase family protein [Pseudovibrio japonicus]GHB22403.1 nucleoside-diphosphate sugar epimerase [Pseudovibrio japonicus]
MTDRVALVFGATGLVGSEVVKLLVADASYSEVHVLVRRELGWGDEKLHVHLTDFRDLSSLQLPSNVTDVFCCLGTTQKKAGSKEAFYAIDFQLTFDLIRMAREAGAEQLLMISSIGAAANSSSYYLKVKGELEEAVRSLSFSSTSILRPSVLLGERPEHRFAESLAGAVLPRLSILLIGALRKYRPIEGKAVARALVAYADEQRPGFRVLESHEIAAKAV